jgi:hypothetical protein
MKSDFSHSFFLRFYSGVERRYRLDLVFIMGTLLIMMALMASVLQRLPMSLAMFISQLADR